MKRRLFLAALLAVFSTMSAPTTLARVSTAETITLVTTAGVVPDLKASDPNPPDSATGVTTPLLEWAAGETAKWHDVYLGTDKDAVGNADVSDTTGIYRGRQPSAWNVYFLADGLAPGSTYYWRVDEVEEDGTTIHTGDVWSFTALPSTASSPDPPDGATNVPTDADLSWVPGATAITHDVYFGTDQKNVAHGTGGTFKGNWLHTTYDPGTLQMGTVYYWRIDEIDEDSTTIHVGDVWSFTVAGAVPGVKASDPNPPDGETGVTTPLLEWAAGETAKFHDVYLGTNPAPGPAEYRGRQPLAWNMYYHLEPFIPGTTYYWRVDEVEKDGTTTHTGDVWSFTTAISELVELEIMGPDEVVEESSAQYNAIAHYEDGSTKDVTRSATWSLRLLGYASIDENGLLTSAHIDTPTIVTIYADYSEGDVTVSAKKAVLCVPYISEGAVYHVDALKGDDNNDGLSPETAFATIQKGIDSAADADQVLVYPGLYAEQINFKGKAIKVQSAEDAAVLEAPGNFAVSFYMGEGPDSTLRNFVICNSYMGIFIAHSSPSITNVTVVNNAYGVEAYLAEPNIASSIFWNNSQGDLFQCEARYSCIERSGEGTGNLSVDPLFVDPNNDDYHLLSQRGRYWPEHDVWVLDKVTSPCIDAGDPTADAAIEPTPNGGRINMGAYGGTPYASMTERPCAGDINYDGIINMVDLVMLANNWLKSGLPSWNQPPCVIIAAPANGAEFWITVTIELKVYACDTDGTVAKVEFYVGGNKIGADNDGSDGWGISWADYTQGSYTITAKATDDRGATTTSPEIQIEIRASPPPRR